MYYERRNYLFNVPSFGMVRPYKSRPIAFLLCLLFGVFGLHRFYVGKVGTGLLYLLTGGLFGIGFFVDLLTIALGGFRDNMGFFLV